MNDIRKTIYKINKFVIFDKEFRKWMQNPNKILGNYIKDGMTVLDIGCGYGFFSVEIARMVGKSGKVIACDANEEMLNKIRNKIYGTEYEQRITLHRCKNNKIDVSEYFDFVLAFYMNNDVSDQELFFCEIREMLKENGKLLVVEPVFHVSVDKFEETIRTARKVGFFPVEMPKILFSKAVILQME